MISDNFVLVNEEVEVMDTAMKQKMQKDKNQVDDMARTNFGNQAGRVILLEKSQQSANPACEGVVAIIPAYNEERFIGSVVLKARQYVGTVIVVDDGSVDDTANLAAAAGAKVVQHQQNRGKGAALNSGFSLARQLKAEVVALLDGDGQHQADDIPRMIQPILDGKADMVIGSRYLELNSDIPHYRRVGQGVVTFLTNSSSGIPSTDSWSGYRALSQRAIECIQFREGGWGVDPEFQFQAREHDLIVTEVPIIALYDEKAKRNPIPHGVKTVNAIMRMVGQHRPLLFFSVLGSIAMIMGLAAGMWVVVRYNDLRQLAVGIAILSVTFIIVGSLSLFTGIILHSMRGIIIEFSMTSDRKI